MSDLPDTETLESEEEQQLRAMVRGALRDDQKPPDVLGGFQKKLRERSRGKFYADGWSTARHPPENTYLVTSILMLVELAVIYALLAPLSGKAERVNNRPAPVNVVAPAVGK